MGIRSFLKRTRFKINGVLSKEELRSVIEREKARTNRTGERFSVVVFETDEKFPEDFLMQHQIAESLIRRMRAIDSVGWFDESRLGIVLPGTTLEGARRFTNLISKKWLPELNPVSRIYTYPSDLLLNYRDRSTNEKSQFSPEMEVPSERDSKPTKYQDNTANVESVKGRIRYRPAVPLKRAMDIFGAIIGIVAFAPLFLLVAALIKLVSPGPVFFRQERVGRDGEPFTFIKFRTMKPNAATEKHRNHLANLITCACEKERPGSSMVKLDHDPQIIQFGKFLRKTCIDELPQLINVLRGEMSLVGPRPPIPYEVEHYQDWHYGRFDATPGMTGLWQVSGKNRLTFKEMVRLDIRYARKPTLLLDLKIIFKTPIAIFNQIIETLNNRYTTKEIKENA